MSKASELCGSGRAPHNHVLARNIRTKWQSLSTKERKHSPLLKIPLWLLTSLRIKVSLLVETWRLHVSGSQWAQRHCLGAPWKFPGTFPMVAARQGPHWHLLCRGQGGQLPYKVRVSPAQSRTVRCPTWLFISQRLPEGKPGLGSQGA